VCLLSVVRFRDRGTYLAVEWLCFTHWHAHVTKKVVNIEYGLRLRINASWLRFTQRRENIYESVHGTLFEQIQPERQCELTLYFIHNDSFWE